MSLDRQDLLYKEPVCAGVTRPKLMEPLLSAENLAKYLGLALQTVYNRHANGGSLPRCINIGGRLRFHPRDVEAWLTTMAEGPRNGDVKPAVERPAPRRGRPTKAEQISRRRGTQH